MALSGRGAPCGVHRADAEFSNRLFPRFRRFGSLVQIQILKREAGGARLIAVAGGAVFIDCGFLSRRRLLSCDSNGADKGDQYCIPYDSHVSCRKFYHLSSINGCMNRRGRELLIAPIKPN